MKKNTHKKYYIIAAILLVVVAVAVFALNSNGDNLTRVTVERKEIVQSVLAAGNTRAIDMVDLGFERSGRVIATYVDVGSRVTAGQTLIELDSSELQADLLAAQADLAEESALGVTDTIAISDAVAYAKTVIADAYIKADNAVREDIDQFFDNPGGGNNTNFEPKVEDGGSGINLSVSFSERVSINAKRELVQKKLDAWKLIVNTVSDENISTALTQSEAYLVSIQEFVDEVSTVVFTFSAPSSEYVTVVDGFKSDVSTARTTVTTALSNLVAAREKLNTAKANETQTTTGTSAQGARILQFQAQIQNIQSQISKTRIKASFDGIVTKQDVEKGEIVNSGDVVVSIISDDKLEIESNVSEVNIGKIVVGNPVEITLDAFPGETFPGTVAYIDPGETVVDGVVNYKIKVALETVDAKIKSGLTANLTIETAKKSDVVVIPLYTVATKADGTYVTKMSGEEMVEIPVTLGIIGRDGNVEVLSGLSVGDVVVTGGQAQ